MSVSAVSCRSKTRGVPSVRDPRLPELLPHLRLPVNRQRTQRGRVTPRLRMFLSEIPQQEADPDQGRHPVMRNARRLVLHEPANRPRNALAISQPRSPAQLPTRLLGAILEITSQQPGPVACDPRRFLAEKQPLPKFEREA